MMAVSVLAIFLGLAFWGGVFHILRSAFVAKKTGHEAEITRLKAAQAGVVVPAPAPAPAGPSKAAVAAKAVGSAVAWTAPRVIAGTAVVAKVSHNGAQAAIAKAQAAKAAKAEARAKAAKAAKAKATKAAKAAQATPAGGNVLTPEQEKALETPAFMRKAKANATNTGATLH